MCLHLRAEDIDEVRPVDFAHMLTSLWGIQSYSGNLLAGYIVMTFCVIILAAPPKTSHCLQARNKCRIIFPGQHAEKKCGKCHDLPSKLDFF